MWLKKSIFEISAKIITYSNSSQFRVYRFDDPEIEKKKSSFKFYKKS